MKLRRNGLVVSLSASLVVGLGLASWPGYSKEHNKNHTNYLTAWQQPGIKVTLSLIATTSATRLMCV